MVHFSTRIIALSHRWNYRSFQPKQHVIKLISSAPHPTTVLYPPPNLQAQDCQNLLSLGLCENKPQSTAQQMRIFNQEWRLPIPTFLIPDVTTTHMPFKVLYASCAPVLPSKLSKRCHTENMTTENHHSPRHPWIATANFCGKQIGSQIKEQ